MNLQKHLQSLEQNIKRVIQKQGFLGLLTPLKIPPNVAYNGP
jgi:hypothetical protein